MKNFKLSLLLVLVSLFFTSLNAQTSFEVLDSKTVYSAEANLNLRKKAVKDEFAGNLLLGFGLNIVEDGGTGKITSLFTSASSNFSNPFILSAEYYAQKSFSIYTSVSFNKYVAGKLIDGGIIQKGKEASYIAMDIFSKFSFMKLLKSNVLEPYALAGAGFTSIGEHTVLLNEELKNTPSIGRLTLNAGFGSKFWFSEYWGVNLNFIGKWGVKAKKSHITSQTQFSFGGFYRFKKY